MSYQNNEFRPNIYEDNITKTFSDSQDNCYSTYANALHQLNNNSNNIENKTCININANRETDHTNILLKVYNNAKIEPCIWSNRILNNTLYASPYLSQIKYGLSEGKLNYTVLNSNNNLTSSSPMKLEYSLDQDNDYESSNSDLGIDTFGPSSSTSEYSDDVCMPKNFLYDDQTYPQDFKKQTYVKRSSKKYWAQKKFKTCNLRREVKLYKTKNKNWKTMNKRNYSNNGELEKLYSILISEKDKKLAKAQEEIILLTKKNDLLQQSIFIDNNNLYIINEKINSIISKIHPNILVAEPNQDNIKSNLLKHIIEKLDYIHLNIAKKVASTISQNSIHIDESVCAKIRSSEFMKMYEIMSLNEVAPINSSVKLESHKEKIKIIEAVLQLGNDEKVRRQEIAISTLLRKVVQISREKKAVDKKISLIEEDLATSKKSETSLKQLIQELKVYKRDSCQNCKNLNKQIKENDTFFNEKVNFLKNLCKTIETENLMLKTRIKKHCNEIDDLEILLGNCRSQLDYLRALTTQDQAEYKSNLNKNEHYSHKVNNVISRRVPWHSMEQRILASQIDVSKKSTQILGLHKQLKSSLEHSFQSEQSWKKINENLQSELQKVQEDNCLKSKTIQDQNVYVEELKILLRINAHQFQLLKQELKQSQRISRPFKSSDNRCDSKKIEELIKRSEDNLNGDYIQPVSNSVLSLKTEMTALLDRIYKYNITNEHKQIGLSLFQELKSEIL